MQTARRLYVYLLTGISLGALVAGLSMLLTVLFETLGLRGSGDVIFGGGDPTREQLTLASAITVVALPVWLAHWIAAERSVSPKRATADEERSSDVRGLYFAIALGALLLATGIAAWSLVNGALLALTGAEQEFSFRNPAADLALLITAGAAWLYHVAVRARDWRTSPIHGAGAFLPRTYVYLAAFVGLLVLLFGITGLIDVAGRLILDQPSFGSGDEWWAFPLAGAIAGILVGGAAWLGHWVFSTRLLADDGWRGGSERSARLRLAYYLVVIVVTLAITATFLAPSVAALLLGLLGAGVTGDEPLLGSVLIPLLTALVFGAAWLIHRRWLAEEADALADPERTRTAGRLEEYGTSLVGLALTAGGVASLIGTALDALVGGGAFDGGEFLLQEVANNVPVTLLGFALWAWSWRRAQARYAGAPALEAAATSRRAYLLIVVAVSLLSGIGTLIFILYRLFGAAFGVPISADLMSELSRPIGGLAVAIVVGLYHAAVLRRDQALRQPEAPAVAVEPAAVGVTPPTAAPAPAVGSVVLRLVGPAGSDSADAARVTDALRAALPEGFVLETVSSEASD